MGNILHACVVRILLVGCVVGGEVCGGGGGVWWGGRCVVGGEVWVGVTIVQMNFDLVLYIIVTACPEAKLKNFVPGK